MKEDVEAVDLGEAGAAVRRLRTVNDKSPKASSSSSTSWSLEPAPGIHCDLYSRNRRSGSTRARVEVAIGASRKIASQ